MMRPALRGGWALLKESIDLWTSNNAFQLAGALAFYTLFSLAPLLIIVISITGMVFGEEAVRGEIASQIDQYIGSDAAAMVQEAVRNSRIEEAGILPTLLGVGAVLFGATTVFAQLQAALNAIWGVTARPSRRGIVVFVLSRIVSFGMVLVIGFLLLMSFLMTMAVRAMVRFAEHWIPFPSVFVSSLDLGISLVVAFLLFGLIFKVLPDVRLSWGNVARGAALTAVLFVLGQYFISLYLTHSGPASTYGAAGALVLILMWVYYSALIIFFGAAFTRANVRRRGGIIHPSAGAVKVHTEIVEEPPEEADTPSLTG
jgi:membrane protein